MLLGSSGEITPGKSTVFAAAEVFFCILIRKFPSLNPALKSVSLQTTTSPYHTAYVQLSSSTILTMPHLLTLCSPRGTLAILPVILHILLTSLRQLVEDDVPYTDPRSVALIQCLRTLSSSVSILFFEKYFDGIVLDFNLIFFNIELNSVCTEFLILFSFFLVECWFSFASLIVTCLVYLQSFMENPAVGTEWEEIMRSAVLRLTDIAKTVKDKHAEASVSLMLAVSVIILTASDKVSRVENVFYPCVNMFKQYLDSRNSPVTQIQALQTLGQIFRHPNKLTASAFIRHLSPGILASFSQKQHSEKITSVEEKENTQENTAEYFTADFSTTENSQNSSELDLKDVDHVVLIIERLKSLEVVVEMADASAKDLIVQCIAPVYIQFLQEPSAIKSNEVLARLHAFCLGRLQRMAPTNPEGFRKAVTRNPELKKRLEMALSARDSAAAQKSPSPMRADSTPKTARRLIGAGGDTVPSIKLKVDFSNFGS